MLNFPLKTRLFLDDIMKEETEQDLELVACIEAFHKLVREGGHEVEEWLEEHETDISIILYGDCVKCLTELQLRVTKSGRHPSKEAARPCPSSFCDDGPWEED
jgi:hypothetical protein